MITLAVSWAEVEKRSNRSLLVSQGSGPCERWGWGPGGGTSRKQEKQMDLRHFLSCDRQEFVTNYFWSEGKMKTQDNKYLRLARTIERRRYFSNRKDWGPKDVCVCCWWWSRTTDWIQYNCNIKHENSNSSHSTHFISDTLGCLLDSVCPNLQDNQVSVVTHFLIPQRKISK